MSKKIIFETKVDYLGFPIMEATKAIGHRIEAGYNEENPYKGPTSTADVCDVCFDKLKKDDTSLNNVLKAGYHNGEPKKADYWAAEAIPHPTYQDGDYKCQSCGVALRDDPRDDVSFAESESQIFEGASKNEFNFVLRNGRRQIAKFSGHFAIRENVVAKEEKSDPEVRQDAEADLEDAIKHPKSNFRIDREGVVRIPSEYIAFVIDGTPVVNGRNLDGYVEFEADDYDLSIDLLADAPTNPEDAKKQKKFLAAAEKHFKGNFSQHDGYSGRAMFGSVSPAAVVTSYYPETPEGKAFLKATGARYDSMGGDVIYYLEY